jgi:hypothetical protein
LSPFHGFLVPLRFNQQQGSSSGGYTTWYHSPLTAGFLLGLLLILKMEVTHSDETSLDFYQLLGITS